MNSKEFAEMEKLDTATLVTIAAEVETSQRKQAALHILEIRRTEPLRKSADASAASAKSSATATVWAAIAAFISATAAIIALFRHSAN